MIGIESNKKAASIWQQRLTLRQMASAYNYMIAQKYEKRYHRGKERSRARVSKRKLPARNLNGRNAALPEEKSTIA